MDQQSIFGVVAMKEIKIKIADWVDENETLMLLSGQELVAFKTPKSKWKVKKVRCDQCGECCMDTPKRHTPFGSNEEGVCNALKKEGNRWVCDAKQCRPFRCLPDPFEGLYDCCIEYY